MTPGENLRRLREAARMSAAELAVVSGVPKDTIISWEKSPGRLNPLKPEHQEKVKKLAEALDVPESEIWGLGSGHVRDGRPAYSGDMTKEIARFLLDLSMDEESIPETVRDRAGQLLARVLPTTKSA